MGSKLDVVFFVAKLRESFQNRLEFLWPAISLEQGRRERKLFSGPAPGQTFFGDGGALKTRFIEKHLFINNYYFILHYCWLAKIATTSVVLSSIFIYVLLSWSQGGKFKFKLKLKRKQLTIKIKIDFQPMNRLGPLQASCVHEIGVSGFHRALLWRPRTLERWEGPKPQANHNEENNHAPAAEHWTDRPIL